MTGQSNWVLQLEKQNHLALLAMRNAPEKTWQHAKEGVTNTKQTSEGRRSCCFDLVHGISDRTSGQMAEKITATLKP